MAALNSTADEKAVRFLAYRNFRAGHGVFTGEDGHVIASLNDSK